MIETECGVFGEAYFLPVYQVLLQALDYRRAEKQPNDHIILALLRRMRNSVTT